jgi:phage gpG-like protein
VALAGATEIIWNTTGLNALLRSPAGVVGKDLARRAVKVESAAKNNIQAGNHGPGEYGSGVGPNSISGRLRSSITWSLGIDELGVFADIGSNVEYARFVELGTVNMPGGYPYLLPALDAARF